MPWLKFTEKYDYHVPGKPVTIAYKPGQVKNVTTPCAMKAQAARKAVPATREDRDEAARQNR